MTLDTIDRLREIERRARTAREEIAAGVTPKGSTALYKIEKLAGDGAQIETEKQAAAPKGGRRGTTPSSAA